MLKSRPRKGFPTSVRVISRIYKIRYWTEEKDFGENPRWGEIDPSEGHIEILDMGQPRMEMAGILLHEILHAIIEEMQIKAVLDLDTEKEEHTVTSIASGLISVLVDISEDFWKSPKKPIKKGKRK